MTSARLCWPLWAPHVCPGVTLFIMTTSLWKLKAFACAPAAAIGAGMADGASVGVGGIMSSGELSVGSVWRRSRLSDTFNIVMLKLLLTSPTCGGRSQLKHAGRSGIRGPTMAETSLSCDFWIKVEPKPKPKHKLG